MGRHKGFRYLATVAALLLLTSCQASTGTVKSNRSETYAGTTKRLFILANLGHTLGYGGNNQDAVFSSTMADSLGQCGIQTDFFAPDPLAIKNVANAEIAKFGPDAALTISWQSGRSGGSLNDTVLLLQFIDMKSKSVVWKASVDFSQHWYAGTTFAGLLITRMKQDGLIDQSCPVPQVK